MDLLIAHKIPFCKNLLRQVAPSLETVPASDGQESATVPSKPRSSTGQAPPLPLSAEAGQLKSFMPKARYGAPGTRERAFPLGTCSRGVTAMFALTRPSVLVPSRWELCGRKWVETSCSHCLAFCTSVACSPQVHVPEYHCDPELRQESCGVQ